jgi:hypothetical protein
MNEDVRRQWLAALRSGEFTQGKNTLTKIQSEGPDTYCCLGVLCALAERAGVTGSRVISLRSWDPESDSYCTEQVRQYVPADYPTADRATGVQYLPEPVAEWLGTGTSKPKVMYKGCAVSLTDLNDAHNLTFAQIADLIESSPSVGMMPQLSGEDYAEWLRNRPRWT